MEPDFWDFHIIGDENCDACVVEPVTCEVCKKGLIHTQFDADLVAVEGKCDRCQFVDEPASLVIE